MKKRADHQAGYVLHTYPYKESSLIVEAFTRAFGRVALLARGARRPRSAMRGMLLSFHPLRLGWSSSAEMGTLIAAEWAGALQPLAGRGLMCGPMPSRNSSAELTVSGQTLLDLAADQYDRPETRDEARMLLRALIGRRLHGQTLHTRTVLRELTDL